MLQRNIVTTLSKEFKFSYQSKCGDLKNAMKALNYLQHSILNDDELEIAVFETSNISSDNKLCILLELKLYSAEKLDRIVQQFDVLTVYLDSISLK